MTAKRHLAPFIDHGWLEQDEKTSGPQTEYRIVVR